jgi:acetate kinase
MNVLVVNCGSSSIKYQIFDVSESRVLTSGILDRIGEGESRLKHRWLNDNGEYDEVDQVRRISHHREGFDWIVAVNTEHGSVKKGSDLYGIGHRVVHGGEAFHEPILIDEEVISTIREMVPLAPLHNPANLTGIEVARERRPDVPQVAVFDTAFHQSMPPHAFHYAIPHELYAKHHIRRYGFHGTSHYYVAKEAASHLGKPLESVKLITLHLGNGASAAAIASGKSIDTSMGMTPLEGLIMGTRCGDIDPAIHFYLKRSTGMTDEELESMLNKESGLKGVCGENDMREAERLAEEGDERAQLAIHMFCYRIKKYIGAYIAVLGGVDAIIFTGGIGENSSLIRKLACQGLAGLGIIIDMHKNKVESKDIREVQQDGSPVKVLVIPTNEELEIARQTVECIKNRIM